MQVGCPLDQWPWCSKLTSVACNQRPGQPAVLQSGNIGERRLDRKSLVFCVAIVIAPQINCQFFYRLDTRCGAGRLGATRRGDDRLFPPSDHNNQSTSNRPSDFHYELLCCCLLSVLARTPINSIILSVTIYIATLILFIG